MILAVTIGIVDTCQVNLVNFRFQFQRGQSPPKCIKLSRRLSMSITNLLVFATDHLIALRFCLQYSFKIEITIN